MCVCVWPSAGYIQVCAQVLGEINHMCRMNRVLGDVGRKRKRKRKKRRRGGKRSKIKKYINQKYM